MEGLVFMKKLFKSLSIILSLLAFNACTYASEANLIVPDFSEDLFNLNLLKTGILKKNTLSELKNKLLDTLHIP